ncbi:hypothetical protein HpNP133_13650 [Helicobacter pylori]
MYVEKILQSLQKKYPYQKEFHQAVYEAITSLKPLLDSDKSYEKHAILERLIEPEREIFFRVCWQMITIKSKSIEGVGLNSIRLLALIRGA